MYAHYMTAMIPTNFNFNYSAELLSEVIIGGTGSSPARSSVQPSCPPCLS